MNESCPGEKLRQQLISAEPCETAKEEVVREKVLSLLLAEKGFALEDLEIDVPYAFQVGQEAFLSRASLVITLEGRRLVLIKCGAGSILARERSTLALARLLTDYQIPLAVVTNSEDATLLDTVRGDTLDCGLAAIPTKERLLELMKGLALVPLPEKRSQMEMKILAAFEGLSLHGECH
jgi:Type I restriction enzyme R protein N terminus (HSDR_N)